MDEYEQRIDGFGGWMIDIWILDGKKIDQWGKIDYMERWMEEAGMEGMNGWMRRAFMND